MSQILKNRFLWIYGSLFVFVLYLCFYNMERSEIGDVDIIRTIGIDEKDGVYTISGIYSELGGSDASIGGLRLISGMGNSIYEAYEDMKLRNQKDLTIAHTSFYLLSDSTAKAGLEAALDFIVRDHSAKMSASVYIYETGNVKQFMADSIDKESEIHESLAAIHEKQLIRLTKMDNSLNYIVSAMYDEYSSILIPYLAYDGEHPVLNGYAVFKDDSLYSYLDNDISLGVDLLRNRLRKCPVYLDNNIGIEITDYHVSKKASVVNGNIQVTLGVNFESDIREVPTKDEVFEEYYLTYLNKQQNEYIVSVVNKTVQYMMDNQVDLIGVSDTIRSGLIQEWDTIAGNWRSYFRNIDYEFDVVSKIGKNYILSR